jgi:hypothetical protein
MVPAFAGSGSGGADKRHAGEVSFTLDINGMRSELSGVEEQVANLRRLAADLQSSSTLKRKPGWDQ